MPTALNCYAATVLFVLVQRSFPAMVLPRPPSSPNHIQHFDQTANDQKYIEGKALQSFPRNPDVERANINDYSLVEIDLQSPEEVDASSLQNIVRAMLKESEEVHNDSYPNPEVIPHSIFGVRDVGLLQNFKADSRNENRHVSMSPLKYQNLDEKLYYLKNSKPKVYVNVRGYSGSFNKDAAGRTTPSNNPIEYLRVTPTLQRQTDWKSQRGKKVRPPKKFDRRVDSSREYPKRHSRNETKKLNRLAVVYGLDDLSTTENSMVTSSELPKQIPAPPWKLPSRTLMAQTTPVQRYALRRTDILPGYSLDV